jgi:uncharacterized short protein YbdD (DUF466 family)
MLSTTATEMKHNSPNKILVIYLELSTTANEMKHNSPNKILVIYLELITTATEMKYHTVKTVPKYNRGIVFHFT